MSLMKAISGMSLLIKQAQDLDRRSILIGQKINGETQPNPTDEVAARSGDDLTTLLTVDVQRVAKLLDRIGGNLTIAEVGLGLREHDPIIDLNESDLKDIN